jgi:hypothetical protein
MKEILDRCDRHYSGEYSSWYEAVLKKGTVYPAVI